MKQAPRRYTYKQQEAILTVGIDENGRIYSSIEKNGKIYAKDLYIHIPSEPDLNKQGWIRYHE